MPRFSDFTFPSTDGRNELHVRRCDPDGAPRGVVQIAHGIAEYAARYDDFTAFLAANGFVVVADDHLGHGQSVQSEDDLGFFAEQHGWELAVGDMRRLFELMRREFPALPYFLFGHSMGSFLSRTYLIKYPDGLTGCVLSGTGQQPGVMVMGGKLMSAREVKKNGPRFRSLSLNKLAFGSYNKAFEPRRTDVDWLSRDNAVVDQYVADPLCGFVATAKLMNDMMGGIEYNQKAENLARMNKALPVYFMSGDMDPVGANGKGVRQAAESFKKAGMQDVTVKLYPQGRHEMLNELNKQEVYADVLAWIESKVK